MKNKEIILLISVEELRQNVSKNIFHKAHLRKIFENFANPLEIDQVVSQNEEIATHFNNYSNIKTMGLTIENGVSEINCLTAHC